MASKEARVLELVQGIIGHACWSAIASEQTDYVIVLDCGEKRRRTMRLANPRLSFLQRTYEGEYSFLIECNWRLDGPLGVVASCYDSSKPGGLMLKALAELESRTIEDVAVLTQGLDLSLKFSGDYVMRCLSTEMDVRGKRNNWSFWSPSGLVTVGPRARITIESSAEAEKRFSALKRSLAQDEEDVVSRFRRERKKESDDEEDPKPEP